MRCKQVMVLQSQFLNRRVSAYQLVLVSHMPSTARPAAPLWHHCIKLSYFCTFQRSTCRHSMIFAIFIAITTVHFCSGTLDGDSVTQSSFGYDNQTFILDGRPFRWKFSISFLPNYSRWQISGTSSCGLFEFCKLKMLTGGADLLNF